MLRRFRAIAPVMLLTLGSLPATGCSCPDINCNAPSVAVELGEAASAEVCINDQCGTAQEPISYPPGWVELFFEDVPSSGVRQGEDFSLSITVLDPRGAVLASTSETRKYDADRCSCLFFTYRWTGTEIDRAD